MISYTKQESQFELTPEGTFDAVITEVGEYNSPTGDNKLMVSFTYTDPETLENRTHKEFVRPMVSTGDGWRVFADLLAVAGIKAEDSGEFDETLLVGKAVQIRVAHSEGKNGKTYANVQEVSLSAPLKKK